MLCAPYKRSLDILQQNWTFGTKGQKLQILCVWQKRTGEVKVQLLVSYVLIIAASEKNGLSQEIGHIPQRQRKCSQCSLPACQGQAWPQVLCDWTARCTQTASQSTWDTPRALPNMPILTVAKLQCNWEVYYRIGDNASFGKCGFADPFKNIARCIYHSVLMSERSLLHCSFHKQNNILPQTKIRQQFNTEIFRQHVTRINFKDCTYSPPWVKAFLTHQENQANKVYVSS